MAKLTKYELERLANVEKNKKLLQELGLDEITNTIIAKPPKDSKKRKAHAERGRENNEDVTNGEQNGRPAKAARIAGEDADENGQTTLRRSSRNAGKKIDYIDMEGEPRNVNKRTQNPKQYGRIPGVQIGSWWQSREACSLDAVHAPWVAGIAPGPQGAYSIALSGGYDDDVDLGNGFTFTGSGGRDLKGTKENPKNLRTAPQSSDQNFDNNFNKSLKKSAETKRPVRVIRGFKLRSPFAPIEGYRYDGLYTVEKAWQEVGVNSKFLVCKFAFKRLPGQPPLPKRDLEAEAQEIKSDFSYGESDDEKTWVESMQDSASTMQVDDEDVESDAEGEDDEE